MSAAVARKIVFLLVDRTLEDHYEVVSCTYCSYYRPSCNFCAGKGKIRRCDFNCHHQNTLPVARLVEAGLTIGKKRARLDLPDSPEILRLLSAQAEINAREYNPIMLPWADQRIWPSVRAALYEISEAALAFAVRSPLDRLAEAGLELD